MSRMLFLLGLAAVFVPRAGTARSKDTPAPIVIVGEVEHELGPHIGCGILHVIGEAELRVVTIERGTVNAEHIVIEQSCPGGLVEHQQYRMELRTIRPATWPHIGKSKSRLPDRFYLKHFEKR